MQKIIDVKDYPDELNSLERLHYEVQGRENVINFLIRQEQKNTSFFEEIWEEYLVYLKLYQEMKNNFEINCINKILENKNYTKWSVLFDKKEVIIDE